MPRFELRLEDPNSEEFRVIRMAAPDEGHARAVVNRREQKLVNAKIAEPKHSVNVPDVYDEESGEWVPGDPTLLPDDSVEWKGDPHLLRSLLELERNGELDPDKPDRDLLTVNTLRHDEDGNEVVTEEVRKRRALRGQLHQHNQAEPYRIVSVVNLDEDESREARRERQGRKGEDPRVAALRKITVKGAERGN